MRNQSPLLQDADYCHFTQERQLSLASLQACRYLQSTYKPALPSHDTSRTIQEGDASICSPCSCAGAYCCCTEKSPNVTAINVSYCEPRPPSILPCSPTGPQTTAAEETVFLSFCQLCLTASHKSSCGSTLGLQTVLLLFPTKALTVFSHALPAFRSSSISKAYFSVLMCSVNALLFSFFTIGYISGSQKTQRQSQKSLMLFLLFHKMFQYPRRTLLISERGETHQILNTTK